MANVSNPRKQFQFAITIAGFSQFYAQKVTLPEEMTDVVEHGDVNFDVKTGGRSKVGKLIIEKISTATGADNYFSDWRSEVQNTTLGGGSLPSIYKRTVVIEEFSVDGVTVINTHTYYGCWPSKRDAIELDRKGSENTIEKVELEVDEVTQS